VSNAPKRVQPAPDACLSEPAVADLAKCIRSNLDCADIRDTTRRVLSRHTGYDANLTRAVLQACAHACRSCGDECARHANAHEHWRVCADICRRCEQACTDLLSTLGLEAHSRPPQVAPSPKRSPDLAHLPSTTAAPTTVQQTHLGVGVTPAGIARPGGPGCCPG
jgi:hypothetical protein